MCPVSYCWGLYVLYVFLLMFDTKHVQPDDGLLIKSKHVAPLNTYTISCVDCYYVIITLKHNGMSEL
jgi:hypothetical protein